MFEGLTIYWCISIGVCAIGGVYAIFSKNKGARKALLRVLYALMIGWTLIVLLRIVSALMT